jgi:hypothetical protein
MMKIITDKKHQELNVGDNVVYINTSPKPFSLRGERVGFTPIGTARDGECLYMIDVQIKFVNKEPAKNSIVRIWYGQLEKYDAERTTVV